jgi:hypothetical protein
MSSIAPPPDPKRSIVLSVLAFALGASLFSITLFLMMVKARVDPGAQATLERTALGCAGLGILAIAGGFAARRRRSPPAA